MKKESEIVKSFKMDILKWEKTFDEIINRLRDVSPRKNEYDAIEQELCGAVYAMKDEVD